MRLSPRYLFPIAEGTDPRRNHPSVVDGPRTEGIEAVLRRIDDRLQSGTSVVAASAQFSTISFPNGPFAATPLVVACIGDAGGPAMVCKVLQGSTTASAFAVLLYDQAGSTVTTGNYRINWIAFGEPA